MLLDILVKLRIISPGRDKTKLFNDLPKAEGLFDGFF